MAKLAPYLLLAIALVLNAAANVLLRVGAVSGRAPADAAAVGRALAFLNGVTLAAIALFGLNILVYRKALERLPLTLAYPVMLSGSLILATLVARAVPSLHETLSPLRLAGMGVIVIGVWMVARG